MYKQLTWADRLKLEALLNAKLPKKEIAKQLGVHFSTVYREIKRGQYDHLNKFYIVERRYSPDIAEDYKQTFLKAKGPDLKIGADHAYANYLEYMICQKKYSPAAALAEARKSGQFETSISHTTLYRYIDDGLFLTLSRKDLIVKKKKRIKRVKRQSEVNRGTSIEKRPDIVNDRSTFGHWEMDTVVGKQSTQKSFLVLTERYSRFEIIRVLNRHTSQAVLEQINALERKLGPAFKKIFKTITCDNGYEFQYHTALAQSCRTKSARTELYYCHAYASWERGSNENQNRLIRRFYPKGIDLKAVLPNDAKRVQDWINNYPRQILNWQTSKEVFEACLKDYNISI